MNSPVNIIHRTVNAGAALPGSFSHQYKPNQQILFVDELVFSPSPDSLTQETPPIPLKLWLQNAKGPMAVGPALAAAPFSYMGAPTLIVFFGDVICVFNTSTDAPQGFTLLTTASYSDIANLPAGFDTPDAAFSFGGITYLVKGRDAVTLTYVVTPYGSQFMAGPPKSMPFAASIPEDWPNINAIFFLPDLPTLPFQSTSGQFVAISEDQLAFWVVEDGTAQATNLEVFWTYYTGIPITSPPSLPAGGHGTRSPVPVPVPPGFTIQNFISENPERYESTKQLAHDLSSDVLLQRDLNRLSWFHGPNAALQQDISKRLRADQNVQTYRNETAQADDDSMFIGAWFTGGVFLSLGTTVGLGMNTQDDTVVATASLDVGGGLLGLAGGMVAGYFTGNVDQSMLGGAFALSGTVVAGPAGIVGTAYFGESGFLGFTVSLGTGVEAGVDISGSYVWEMARWSQ